MLQINRILLVSTLLRGHGGMETAIDHFVKGMASAGVEVKIIFLGKKKNRKHTLQWCQKLDYQILCPSYPFKDPIRDQIEKRRLKKIIDSWNPDISIALNNAAFERLYSARKITSRKFLIYSWVHFSLKILRRIETIKKADFHLAISSGIKEELISLLGIEPSKIHTIWNPFIKDDFLIKPSPTKTNYLFVGRLTPQKDPKKLINNFSHIPGDWTLHIVGDGEMKLELVALAERLKINRKIVWHGWQPEPWKYIKDKIKNVTCLIMTSRNEGFPMVLIEAISRGIFCISTDCPTGPKDIINSSNGILVSLEDSQGIVKAIDWVSHNRLPPPDEISQSVDKFNLDNYIKNVLSFFVATAEEKDIEIKNQSSGRLPNQNR